MPKWRIALYLLAFALITGTLGHAFDPRLYWVIPIGAGFLVVFFAALNWLVRDPDRRTRLRPYAKWLILAAVLGNVILLLFKIYGTKGR